MTHRTLLLSVCPMLFTSLLAQTLTDLTTSPIPDDSFLTHSGTGPAIGAGGANVTWDMSTVVEDNVYQYDFFTPAGTPWQGQFPTATVVEANGAEGFFYYRSSVAGFDYLGSGDTSGVMICADPNRIFNYPLSFGGSWTDVFNCTGDSSGFFGSISVTADGYGNLILPFGTVSNVLRTSSQMEFSYIFTFQSQTDTFTISSHTLAFHKPGVHNYVLSGNADGSNVNWLDQFSIGMQEAMSHPIGIDLLPNPAIDEVEVVYSSTGPGMTCTVLDATGRIVYEQGLNGPVGISRDRIDLAGWTGGLYSLRITDGDGAIGVKRLIVAR